MWRLSDPRVFAALARTRHRRRTGPLRVAWVPGNPSEPPRVGYAIAKRVGGAVVRNRLRRRLRVAVRSAAPPAGAYLISVAPAAAELTWSELEHLVRRALTGLAPAPSP